MTGPINVTGNIAGIGAKGPDDPLKITKSQASKYKKRNLLSFKTFIRGVDKLN